jgi:flavodoxin I
LSYIRSIGAGKGFLRGFSMRAVIVYDSEYGNTERIAKAIAGGLASGGEVRLARVNEITPAELRGARLIIIGSPTQGGRPTKAMIAFLDDIPEDALKGVKVVAFDTRMPTKLVKIFGYAAGRIADSLQEKGGTLVTSPEGFFVNGSKGPLAEGEMERAESWAKALANSG